MIDIGQLEAFLAGYLGKWLVSQTHTEDIVRQMSFGLIQVYPPAGEPSITSQLNNIVFQIQSLREHLDTANTEMIEQNVDILAAIGGLPDGASPVVLPTTPPAGYGVDDGTIASAVWGYMLGPGTAHAGDLLHDAGWAAVNQSISGVAFPVDGSKYYKYSGSWTNAAGSDSHGGGAAFPVANILSTDDLVTFLERESYYTGWTANDDGTYYVFSGSADYRISTTITSREFLLLRRSLFPGPSELVLTPPVWPGLDLVTLGTPVALDLGVTITEPMDGVIISITSAPPKQGYFTFDDMLSYRNYGALAFIDDNGDAEMWQGLGFTSAIYCPKAMRQAAGVKLRISEGGTGTITPWTVTPT